MRNRTFFFYSVIIGSLGCLLAGCLAILPPVFAQQSVEPLPVEDSSIVKDEPASLLSLGAIILALAWWGVFRVYQHIQLIKQPNRVEEIRRRLLVRIAKLDDRYAKGDIQRHVYDHKRQQLKSQVIELTKRYGYQEGS